MVSIVLNANTIMSEVRPMGIAPYSAIL
jgi:hypothetical protein